MVQHDGLLVHSIRHCPRIHRCFPGTRENGSVGREELDYHGVATAVGSTRQCEEGVTVGSVHLPGALRATGSSLLILFSHPRGRQSLKHTFITIGNYCQLRNGLKEDASFGPGVRLLPAESQTVARCTGLEPVTG